MKKYFKKLLITSLAAVGTLCLAAGLAACGNGGNDNPPDDNPQTPTKVPLIAPVLDISGDVLSWNTVAHADGYVVYENDVSVSEQAETSYTITQDYPGTYTYTVKATTTEKGYSESPISNSKKFTVAPYVLEAPVITIDEDGVITWSAVDHADNYEIYENGTIIAAVSELTYTIEQTTPAVFTYTVVATSTDKAYTKSAASNAAEYHVPLYISLGVEFPDGFEGTVTLGIYDKSDKLVAQTEVTRDQNGYEDENGDFVEGEYSNYGSARFVIKEWGDYVAKIINLNKPYVATWVRLSKEHRSGSITIAETTNALELGKQTITATVPADENFVTMQYVFVAGASTNGAHSIMIDESLTGVQISVAGKTIINTDQRLFTGSFSTIEGEAFIVSITYTKPEVESEEPEAEEPVEEQISFTIEIVNYGIRQYLKLCPEPYNVEKADQLVQYANTIFDSCTRYLVVEEAGDYAFFFPTTHAHNTFITVVINGQSYDFSGGALRTVHLEAGDDIEIEITLSNSAEILFYVYPAPVEAE